MSTRRLTIAGCLTFSILIISGVRAQSYEGRLVSSTIHSKALEEAQSAFDKWVRVVVASADRFVASVSDVRVLVIEGGSHEIVQIHAGEVLAPVRAFLLE